MRAREGNRTLVILVAFAIGLLLGWIVLGWWLFPVTWTNAYLQDLRLQDKQLYLTTVAEAYFYNPDLNKAVARLQPLGTPEEVVEVAEAAYQTAQSVGDVATVAQVQKLATDVGLQLTGSPVPLEPTVVATPEEPAETGGSNLLAGICRAGLGIVILVGGIALALWLLGRRRGQKADESLAQPIQPPPIQPAEPLRWEQAATEDLVATPPPPASGPAPSATAARRTGGVAREFMAQFQQGVEAYDQSFDIEDADSGYLGECGMTVSEYVDGDANRVTALEVWLFDKSDIRTVTKVIMSDYAYGNQPLRDKLASRGEPLLAAPGLGFVLDAQTLRLEGQVTDLQYVDGDAPARSTFRRVSVALRVARQVA